ncbi:MAG: hypothetical protein FIA92_04075 [Chloroflexi bacterium]|nr:hypothetical protein [Chloroflexota bacterium]
MQPRNEPFLRRHRTRLMWAGAIVVFGVLGFMAYLNATSPAYGCTIVFDPTPAPATSGSPAPAGEVAFR